MTKQEIIEEFKRRYINSKNNNYIFTEINDFGILDDIPDVCSISMPDTTLDIEYAHNIKINLDEVEVRNVLSYTLELLKEMKLLDVSFDYNIELKNKFDLLRFQHVLSNYNRAVQLIFYNIEALSIEDQMLFNEIYYFHSFLFNVNSFIKGSNFQSYFLTGDRVLDNRENYTRVKTVNIR